VKKFHRDGIIVLNSFFNTSTCDEVLSIIDETILNEKNNNPSNNIKTINNEQLYHNDKRVIYSFDFSDTDSLVNSLVHNSELKNICETLISANLNFAQHWTKRVFARDSDADADNKLMNERWHQDSVGLNSIGFIVYLDDVDEKQGPFEYVTGSHKQNIDNVYDYVKANSTKAIKYYGKKGDVIIANVAGWHKANMVTDGQRDTLQVLYISKWADKINKVFKYGTYLK